MYLQNLHYRGEQFMEDVLMEHVTKMKIGTACVWQRLLRRCGIRILTNLCKFMWITLTKSQIWKKTNMMKKKDINTHPGFVCVFWGFGGGVESGEKAWIVVI
ncbi:hypothetical protein P3S68_018352 [Capsicum galapagoense]